jgi:hypothetical protein
MDRFDRRSYTPSMRATMDVCYHHLTLVRSTSHAKCDVSLLTEFRERMTRALNHMVRNGKIEAFELVCDWSNNSQESIADDSEICMNITLTDSRLFPVAPVSIRLNRVRAVDALEGSSKNEALEEIWELCLPSFDRETVTKGFRNLIVMQMKPYWDQVRNTQDGRTLFIRAVNEALEKLHSNLMIDHDETAIKCHEINVHVKPEDDIEAHITLEGRQGNRIQLDICITPKVT